MMLIFFYFFLCCEMGFVVLCLLEEESYYRIMKVFWVCVFLILILLGLMFVLGNINMEGKFL